MRILFFSLLYIRPSTHHRIKPGASIASVTVYMAGICIVPDDNIFFTPGFTIERTSQEYKSIAMFAVQSIASNIPEHIIKFAVDQKRHFEEWFSKHITRPDAWKYSLCVDPVAVASSILGMIIAEHEPGALLYCGEEFRAGSKYDVGAAYIHARQKYADYKFLRSYLWRAFINRSSVLGRFVGDFAACVRESEKFTAPNPGSLYDRFKHGDPLNAFPYVNEAAKTCPACMRAL